MLDAIATATGEVFTLTRLAWLLAGVLLGSVIGFVPGIGGRATLAILLPFIVKMDPASALVLIVGIHAIGNTADTIPAVLFGIPGSTSATATVMDGYPMAKRGEAERALGASFVASGVGGLIGAFTVLATIPMIRPLVLTFGNPEFFMTAILAIVMIGLLTGGAPVKGLLAGCLGLLIGMVGDAPQTGAQRWTFDFLYLSDGIPLIPVALGLFAIPELIDMTVERGGNGTPRAGSVASVSTKWQGVKDVATHWWLLVRSSFLGSWIGILPGIGSGSAIWLAYGHAVQTSKDRESFGKGDVRGVIAPEAANNASDAGDWCLTLAFGIPGSATMSLVLAAMLLLGLPPGPKMLTDHLHLTLVIVWSLVLANLMATSLCFLFARQLAGITRLPVHHLFPVLIVLIFLAAYQSTADWGDLVALLVFSVIGVSMKRFGWPRPPLIVGMVLQRLAETYFFLTTKLYGYSWLTRPVVILLFALTVATVVHAVLRHSRQRAKA
ncbi:MAG TPA: tripartite tricarboxylate transporter permease [Candidatus Acidoferrales bacterium]|nr:tripartite tricarboxylate transporter permease [Candidatus Acidoferrales bacterium]